MGKIIYSPIEKTEKGVGKSIPKKFGGGTKAEEKEDKLLDIEIPGADLTESTNETKEQYHSEKKEKLNPARRKGTRKEESKADKAKRNLKLTTQSGIQS